MKFFNEAVRKEFHLLELMKQQILTECDEKLHKGNLEIKILMIDQGEVLLEFVQFQCPVVSVVGNNTRSD